jgi:hypothetical protein
VSADLPTDALTRETTKAGMLLSREGVFMTGHDATGSCQCITCADKRGLKPAQQTRAPHSRSSWQRTGREQIEIGKAGRQVQPVPLKEGICS